MYSRPRILSSASQSILYDTASIENDGKNVFLWLDADYDETDTDYQIFNSELNNVIKNVHPFTDCDACIDFLRDHGSNDEDHISNG